MTLENRELMWVDVQCATSVHIRLVNWNRKIYFVLPYLLVFQLLQRLNTTPRYRSMTVEAR